MTVIDEAIYSILSGDSTLEGLVDDRIRPDALDQDDALPAIVYDTDANFAPITMEGDGNLDHRSMTFHCLAENKHEASAVAQALRSALMDWNGTQDGLEIAHIKYDGERTSWQPPERNQSKGRHIVHIDFIVNHRHS